MSFWAPLKALIDAGAIAEATEEATRLALSAPDICRESSDFLTLAAMVCEANRQWAFCQLLSFRAVQIGNSSSTDLSDSATALNAYTAACDVLLRVYPDAPAAHKQRHLDSLVGCLEWFGDSGTGRKYKRKFLMQATGYMDFPTRVKKAFVTALAELADDDGGGSSRNVEGVTTRLRRLQDTGSGDWVLQVDAGEIGNEARYANHADFPNGILVKRCASACNPCTQGVPVCDKWYPHLVALRTIQSGDEITLNYGSSYWIKVRPGTDPFLLGQSFTQPFTDCIYYDGVLEDYSCSDAPGGFLIRPTPTPSKRRLKHLDTLEVKRVCRSHPAYPGFGLYAKKTFSKGEVLCIYAGIVDMSPLSGRHASKYTVDITSDPAIGLVGYHYDPATLVPLSKQRFLPFLTDFRDVSLTLLKGEEDLLGAVENICDIGKEVSQSICRAVLTPAFKPLVKEKLSEIKLPFENGNKRDIQEWNRKVRKVFRDLFSKPPPCMTEKEVEMNYGLRDPPELIVLLGD